ncbi:MAG TPA: hypothetical protein PL139_08630, partial [Candidatus Cloacimonadota bacterium]|nr:hypothetical protein [Candidatus Cloacimonadota bacterium]
SSNILTIFFVCFLIQSSHNNINPGKHNLVWDGKDNNMKNCAAGIYFYKLSSPSFSQTKKMMYIK